MFKTALPWAAIAVVLSLPLSTAITNVLLIVYLLVYVGSAIISREMLKSPGTEQVTIAVLLILLCYIVGMYYSPVDFSAGLQALKHHARLLFIPLLVVGFVAAKTRVIAINLFIAATVALVLAGGFKDSIFTSLFVAFSMYCCVIKVMVSIPIAPQDAKFNFFISPKLSLAQTGGSLEKTKLRILRCDWSHVEVGAYTCLALFFAYYLYFISIGRTGQLIDAILLLMVLIKQSKKIIAVGGILLLIGFIALMLNVKSSFSARINLAVTEIEQYLAAPQLAESTSSAGLRMEFAANTLKLIAQKPLLGWGTGSFATAYNQQFPQRALIDEAVRNPHNQYLLILTEIGILGLLAYSWLFYCILRVGQQVPVLERHLLHGVLLAVSVGCMANSWLRDFTSLLFFISMTAICISPAAVVAPVRNF